VIWCARSDHFCPLFCTTLKSLTNYSAVMKSVIQKILYTITMLLRCCGIFFDPSLKWSKSCAQTMHFQFSEKFQFWFNPKTNVAPPGGIVQMPFQTFERAFLPLKKAEIHIKIELQMATVSLFEWLIPLVHQPFIQVPRSRANKKNRNKNSQLFYLTPPCSGEWKSKSE